MSVHLSLCSDTHRFPALHSVSPFLPIFDFHQTALLQLSQNTHTSTCSLCIWSTVLYAHRETEIDRLDRKGKNKSVYGRSEILNRLKNKTRHKSLCQWRRKKTNKKKTTERVMKLLSQLTIIWVYEWDKQCQREAKESILAWCYSMSDTLWTKIRATEP